MKAFCSLFFVLVVCSATCAQDVYKSDDGVFSYELPIGWNLKEFPGLKYKIALGDRMGDYSPNIVIATENFSGTLEEYSSEQKGGLTRIFPDAVYVSESDFTTDSGVVGRKVIVAFSQANYHLKDSFYVFRVSENLCIIAACYSMDEYFEKNEPIFDKSIRTLRF